MDIMDKIQDSTNTDSLKTRFEELKAKEQTGDLDDKGREELAQIKTKLGK